jgi:hypothetical protein
MGTIEKSIIQLLERNPGLSDAELAALIKGSRESPQYINQSCRSLVSKGIVSRKKRGDGLIGNWLAGENSLSTSNNRDSLIWSKNDFFEKRIKQVLEKYLSSHGWEPEIAWGFTHGIDIEARDGQRRWIIEVKGSEPMDLMPVNSFVSVLGKLLQRMDDPNAKYSIAFPDLEHFRRLWERLPDLAKRRTGISALFVDFKGGVTESIP